MATKTETKALATLPNEQTLALLKNEFPTEPGFERILLPRIVFKSQNVMEGQGKNMVVTTEAGTFLAERATDEVDEFGKKVWSHEEIGTEFDAIIVYNRKQLRYYDETNETFTSSPIFDKDDEVIPLFRDKAEVDKDTATNLKARSEYAGFTMKGKPKSLLEDNSVLYVLYNGELYQMSIRGGSMYAYKNYTRTVRPSVPAVLTNFSSEPMEKGTIKWNQMTFAKVRDLTATEIQPVLQNAGDLKEAIQQEKDFYSNKN